MLRNKDFRFGNCEDQLERELECLYERRTLVEALIKSLEHYSHSSEQPGNGERSNS